MITISNKYNCFCYFLLLKEAISRVVPQATATAFDCKLKSVFICLLTSYIYYVYKVSMIQTVYLIN